MTRKIRLKLKRKM